MIEILQAPPYASVQDQGRPGLRAQGVPPSGAMDREALAIANVLVGNRASSAGIEWAAGPGRLHCRRPQRMAVTGAEAAVSVNGHPVATWSAFEVPAGGMVELGPPLTGRFSCLTVAGGIRTPPVLGSRSTLMTAGFGGLKGRALRAGDLLPIGEASAPVAPAGVPVPERHRPRAGRDVRIVPGPQHDRFTRTTWEALISGAWTVSAVADRMGYRLDGPPIDHAGDPAMPSEPAVPGAMQVPVGGTPIVLMPDGPTVGGYAKLAVVIDADLGRMAQLRPGEHPVFVPVSLEEAQEARRHLEGRLHAIRGWAARGGG